MAIEDICKVPGPPPPPPGGGGAAVGNNNNEGDGQPEVEVQRITAGRPPYPEPFVPVGTGQGQQINNQISRPGTTPRFAYASRIITSIPSDLFLSQNYNVQHVYERLEMDHPENERGKRSPFHGAVWFDNHRPNPQPASLTEGADLFRWSQMAIWASDSNSEKFFMPALKKGLSIGQLGLFGLFLAGVQQDQYLEFLELLGIPVEYSPLPQVNPINPISIITDEMPNWPEAPIFTLSPLGPGAGFAFAPNYTLENVFDGPRGEGLYFVETFWFQLFNRALAAAGIPFIDRIPDVPRADAKGRAYMDNFFPDAIKDSDLNDLEKYDMFLDVFLNGAEGEKWDQFTNLPDSLQSTADYFRKPAVPRGYKYLDYTFDAPVAFFEEELNNILLSPFHSAKIDSEANSPQNLVSENFDHINQIPNLYYYYTFLELEKKYTPNPNTKLTQEIIRDRVPEEHQDYVMTTLAIIDSYRQNGGIPGYDLTTPYGLKFPSDRVKNLPKINELIKKYAVNFVEIKINTKQGGPINSMLQRNKMDRIILEKLAPSLGGFDRERNQFFYIGIGNITEQRYDFKGEFNLSSTYVLDDSFKEIELADEQNSILNTLNDRTESFAHQMAVPGFFNNLRKHLLEEEGLELQRVDEFSYPLRYTHCEDKNLLKLEETIKSQIFLSQVETLIAEGSLARSYSDILEGKKAYSEVIGYRVKKFAYEPENESYGDRPEQILYFMDSDEVESFNYIDTQVLPYTKYKYVIDTINLVLATEYEYTNVIIDSPNFNITTNSIMEPLIIYAPFYEQEAGLMDHHPLEPQITWLPRQGVDDKVGILFTTNYGEIKEPRHFVYLNGETAIDNKDTLFRNDSLPSHFFGLRIEEEPEDYGDFITSPTRHNFLVEANGKTGFALQDIEPNKYYYYFFRTFDNYNPEIQVEPSNDGYQRGGYPPQFGQWVFPPSTKDHPYLYSNPGEVFKVRMVSYENGIFFEMEPYEMYKKPKEVKVDFERLLKVQPSFNQTLINFKNSFDKIYNDGRITLPENSLYNLRKKLNLIDNENKNFVADEFEFQKSAPDLGLVSIGTTPSDSSNYIWNKRYKIRIKSKNSGRAIDLNIKFMQKKEDLR